MKTSFFAFVFFGVSMFCPLFAANEAALNAKTAVSNAVVPIPAKIDLNKADIGALAHAFKGIGVKRAAAIINYRDAHNGFKSIEDLAMVRVIGKLFVEKNLQQLKAIFTV